MRADAIRTSKTGTSVLRRATAFDFAGTGNGNAWIGSVSYQPNAHTGPHHHGRHEVGVYVAAGHSEIRWGDRLEFSAFVESGDFIYFAPEVPHSERNLSQTDTLDFVVVRTDNERIAVDLDIVPVDQPERVY